MVICCDDRSWRRDVFPQYKYKRRVARDEAKVDPNKIDFEELFRILNIIKQDLTDNFPYKVIQVAGAEADDIIGALVEETQEFGKHDDIMIVSSDKDFIQLQQYNNVRQYSPMKKGFLQEKDPVGYIMNHVFSGDSGDGVPNVLSDDNVFVDGIRQTPLLKKKKDSWLSDLKNIEANMGEEVYARYLRNRKLILLSEMPRELYTTIIDTYNNTKIAPRSKIFNFLLKKRCKQLLECVSDF